MITAEEFERYLSEKIGAFKCASCGRSEGTMPAKYETLACIQLAGIVTAQNWRLPVAWIYCGHCGQVTFFAKKLIDDWLAGEKQNESKELRANALRKLTPEERAALGIRLTKDEMDPMYAVWERALNQEEQE